MPDFGILETKLFSKVERQSQREHLGIYRNWVFPRLESWATQGLEEVRRELLSQAQGRVLEIGAGIGQNLEFLGPKVEHWTGLEYSPGMLRLARGQKKPSPPTGTAWVQASATSLPFKDQTLDQVISFLVFCSLPDPAQAAREIWRVLKPGGSLLLFEHVLAPDPATQAWQHRLNPWWNLVSCGCQLNRDTAQFLSAAGLDLGQVQRLRHPLMGPGLTANVLVGAAKRTPLA